MRARVRVVRARAVATPRDERDEEREFSEEKKLYTETLFFGQSARTHARTHTHTHRSEVKERKKKKKPPCSFYSRAETRVILPHGA